MWPMGLLFAVFLKGTHISKYMYIIQKITLWAGDLAHGCDHIGSKTA